MEDQYGPRVPLLFENIYNKVNESVESSGKKGPGCDHGESVQRHTETGIDLRRKIIQTDPAGNGGGLDLMVQTEPAAELIRKNFVPGVHRLGCPIYRVTG